MINHSREKSPICHLAPISSVAITPSGKIFTGSYDGALCEWDTSRTEIAGVSRRLLHSKGINCVTIDPTGTFVATGASDGHACLIDLRDPQAPVRVLHHPGDVETAVFSSSGEYVLTGGTDGTARIFDTHTAEQLFVIDHGKTVGASCRHSGEAYVLTGCNDTGIRKIEWATGRVSQECKPHTGPVKALVTTRHGIVSSGHDTRVLLLDAELRFLDQLTAFSTTPKAMAVEPDGGHFWVAAYDQTVTRWRSEMPGKADADTHAPVYRLYDPQAWSHGIAASKDFIAVGSFEGVPRCYRSNASNGYSIVPAPSATVDCISSMVLDHESECLVLGGDSGIVRRLSTSDLVPDQRRPISERVTTAPSAVTGVQGTLANITYGCWDGTLARLADAEVRWTAKWPHQSDKMQHADSPIVGIAQSDEYVLAGLYTGGATCFAAPTGEFLWHQPESSGATKSVSVSRDLFAMTGRYDPLRVGSLIDGTILARLALGTPVSDVVEFNPDVDRLAVCAADFQVWIVAVVKSGSNARLQLSVLHQGEGHTAPVKAIAWLDPETVVSGCYNGHLYVHKVGRPSIRIAQVDSRLGISTLAVNRNRVYWATFDGCVGYCPRELLADI